MTGTTSSTTSSVETVPPLIKSKSRRELDAERRQKLAQRAQPSQPSGEEMQAQMLQQQQRQAQQRAQQEMYNEQRSLRIREVMALEAIAEALHVANEEKILAWREVQAKKQAEEEARVAREQAEARAADFEAVKKTVPEANRLGEVIVHGALGTLVDEEGEPVPLPDGGLVSKASAHTIGCTDPTCKGVGQCTTAEPTLAV